MTVNKAKVTTISSKRSTTKSTIKNAEKSVSQKITIVVDKLFSEHTKNGILILNGKFTTNINNFYKRWKKAETNIKTAKTEGRRKQFEKTKRDNHNKFLYAEKLLKDRGIIIKINNGEI